MKREEEKHLIFFGGDLLAWCCMGGAPSASSEVLICTVPHSGADTWCRQPLWPWEIVLVECGTCRLTYDSGLPRKVGARVSNFITSL